jgi:hypothetical protein
MDRRTITIDPVATKLRRVGRVARRRMRIEGDALRNGVHTDGTLTVEISGLGSPVAGVPDSFEWRADRPVALVIIRAGIDGDDVSFQVGPSRSGVGRGVGVGDGSGIRYVAFCYDAAPDAVAARVAARVSAPAPGPAPTTVPAAAAIAATTAVTRAPIAPAGASAPAVPAAPAAPTLRPTGRERRSILALLLQGGARRFPGGSLA